MPNTFLKPAVIAAASLGLLQRQIQLPALVWSMGSADFAGAYNDTITLRVPAVTTARTRSLRGTGNDRQITLDTLTETGVDVKLSTDVYSAIAVTDEELTLDIKDFGQQVLAPQTRAVAEGIENGLVVVMQGADYDVSLVFDPTDPFGSLVDARKALNDANVPFADRRLVVGSAIEAAILKDDNFHRVDASGTDQALREALIGRIAGFDTYISNALDEDEGYAFHRTAYAMGIVAPRVPDGASFGRSMAANGLALRWLRDYDASFLQDRSIVDAFVGYAAVPDNDTFIRAVRLELKGGSVTMSQATATIAPSGTKQLHLTNVRADGSTNPVPDEDVTWSSSDATKATISSSGLVTGVASGSATITGEFGGQSATCAVTVS